MVLMHQYRWVRVALGVLILLLALLSIILFSQYRYLRGQELISTHMPIFPRIHRGAKIPETDVSLIQSWMTYDYIDHIYALPPDYLKTTLSMSDPYYPLVTIKESAEAQGTTSLQMTDAVRSAVSDYLVKNGT